MSTPAQQPGRPADTASGAAGRSWAVRSLSRSTTNRDAARREQPGLLESLAADPDCRLLLVDARGRVAVEAPEDARLASAWSVGAPLPDDGLAPPASPRREADSPAGREADSPVGGEADSPVGRAAEPPTDRDDGRRAPRLAPLTAADLDIGGLETYYLGREAGGSATSPWLAVLIPPDEPAAQDAEGAVRAHPAIDAVVERYPLAALRAIGADLDAHDAGLATTAAALAAWHGRARFCPACGSPTRAVQAGWARSCPGCGALHFPRTDPAIIVAATDEADRLLMVHGAAWERRRFSVVAGFVEAGESIEAAVIREIAEETGMEARDVEFVASQPWPFPRSLMLAFRARLGVAHHRPRPDGAEVTTALLLGRDELLAAVRAGRIVLPGPTSIGRMLIEDWFGGPID